MISNRRAVAYLLIIFSLFCVASEMEYQDKVASQVLTGK